MHLRFHDVKVINYLYRRYHLSQLFAYIIDETWGNPVQEILCKPNEKDSLLAFFWGAGKIQPVWALVKFCGRLQEDSCGLLTGDWSRKYKHSRSRNKVSLLLYSSLTSCISLIVHDCVLFVLLGDWARRAQGWSAFSLLSPTLKTRKLHKAYSLHLRLFFWYLIEFS